MDTELLIHILLTITIAIDAATGTSKQGLFRRTANVDSTEGVDAIFESVTSTASFCAVVCVSRNDCHGYKFVPGVSATSPGRCLGYATDKECRSSYRRTQRVTSTWLERSCQDVSDCPGLLTACLHGRCLCRPSAFYSVGGDVCVSACAPSDIRTDYQMYNSSDASGSAYHAPGGLCQCQADCVNNPDCNAFTYGEVTYRPENCFLLGGVYSDSIASWWGWTVYKFNCA